ncbi:glucose 1-dehydrogenase [Nocardioides sp. zg-579]|uniref:Glucose 1-dehydrogenase n=1 Tax=Nocardioides marmotae TaxID=2663857 RepID=A0A6I3J3T7_9ACTN|nr:glucose 1-dehydrogenase [Nocardioides marmotae]MCR6030081.1 glucose 1-dehydrogenase [Gordonia jinghuaiqii]MTB93712.1 glucose 1-dehydrogenase [Nocardioides marmotae]QKE00057.1 glucose 1-dehydrogenase [Nocardioides marmotae]
MSETTAPTTWSGAPFGVDSFRLDGKVAIITGASSGLGAAFAVGFARAGADIVICARRTDKLAETAAKVEAAGRKCLAVAADVSVVEDCQRVVDETMAAFGQVDILVNNAGIASATPTTREKPEDYRQVLEVNLFGSYWMAQACGRVMERGSSILNVGSILGSTTAGLPQAAYASSKSAIIGLTRDLAQQWAERKGIRVNALAPGFFTTEMVHQYVEGYLETQIAQRVPMRRAGDPEELIGPAVFLSSDAASYVTGVLLPVDGGTLTT